MRLRATKLSAYGGNARPLWTPARLSTALWLDAADASTITLNGSTVSQWKDKSGNGRNMSQATAANQFSYVTNAQNGLPALRSDGNNRFMITPTRVNLREFVAVAKWTDKTGDYRHLWDPNTTSQYGWHGDTAASGNLIASFASPLIINGDKYINGTLTAGYLSRYTNATIHVFEATGNLDPQYTGFQPGSVERSFYGDYYEIIFLPSIISASDRQKIEGYLAWKWGGF